VPIHAAKIHIFADTGKKREIYFPYFFFVSVIILIFVAQFVAQTTKVGT
jgi:hypothetical protein